MPKDIFKPLPDRETAMEVSSIDQGSCVHDRTELSIPELHLDQSQSVHLGTGY